ncbi:MAG: DNA repair protein RecN [Kordiimonadaceae bacterium]|nr:DNA repair protein RecN [Kordiimonadaceae bacterium]MBO6569030.1 DNA repair protein RecN [Kordiimonadaceae bacterium]MBO6964505.1 DNA repair protein RecN [Kordiimonadaceae bacterium]
MLTDLSIRDIVLIDKLTLSFSQGLNVLTGETGAGKSILLDSLGLALGARADRALVRSGEDRGSVSAVFSVDENHPACSILSEFGVDSGQGELVLRRQVSTDGRSKAWINDEPVSQGALAKVAHYLVEIHGQHDDRGLLDSGAHRDLLDTFAGLRPERDAVAARHAALKQSQAELERLQTDMQRAREDEDYLRHALDELANLAPEAGEEQNLADKRTLMMQGEKAAEDLAEFQELLFSGEGVDAKVRGVLRRMVRQGDELAAVLQPATEALDRAAEELSIADQELAKVLDGLSFNPSELEQVEERLFEYRRLARKHNCQPEDLVTLQTQFHAQLETIDQGEDALKMAKAAVEEARTKFAGAVQSLSKKRLVASEKLDALVNQELPPLKLEKATFRTSIESVPEDLWNEFGAEKVTFEVKTNAGSAFGAMVKVASGGELARFILALKVVLSNSAKPATMVFDEVDRGIGGATASAVGERLKRLSTGSQLLVVTHSPQVAAQGDIQFQISKADFGEQTRTDVVELSTEHRREEIARMLAGAEVTEAARAAAEQLLASTG